MARLLLAWCTSSVLGAIGWARLRRDDRPSHMTSGGEGFRGSDPEPPGLFALREDQS